MEKHIEYNSSLEKYFKNKIKQRPNNWVMITTDDEMLYGKESGKYVNFEGYNPILIEFMDDILLPSGNTIQIVDTHKIKTKILNKSPNRILNKWAEACDLKIYGPFVFKSEWIFSILDIEKLSQSS